MLGTGESLFGCRSIANLRINADVRAMLLMKQRRPGFCGIRRKGHARHRRVLDHDTFGPVLGRTEPHIPQAKISSYEGIVPKTTDWRTLGVAPEELALRDGQERVA